MSITHDQMVRKLAKDGKDILASMTPEKLHVWHMASCLMGEAGEIMESNEHDNLIEELGDLEFYMSGLRDGLNISFEDIAATVITSDEVLFTPVDGLMVATCNIFDACKKWIIYEKEIDRVVLMKHIRRYEFYMYVIREERELTRAEILQANMDKLAKRYGPDYSYSNAAAQNRADKQT